MKLFTSLINTIKEHFRLKLIICFILCAILPLLILGTISYKISYNIAKDKILKETAISCEKNQHLLENRMTQIENLEDSIHFNLCMLCTTAEQPMSNYLDKLSAVRNNIASIADSFNIYHVNIFLPDDTFASKEGLTFCSLSDLKKYKVQLSDFSKQGLTPNWIFRKDINFPYMVSKGEEPSGVLSCYRYAKINSQKTCLAVHITSEELSNYLNTFSEGNPSLSYIINSEGVVLSSTDKKQIGGSLSNEKLHAITQNLRLSHFSYDKCEIISTPVHNQLFLVTETPDYYIRQSSSFLVKMIFICFMIIVPLTMLSIIWVADQMTNKINHLSHSMSEIKMDDVIDSTQIDKLVLSSSTHLDEIDSLTVTCANMISELNSSFENNLRLKIQEEKLNYQLLQSQINPHFLYNILASVQNLVSHPARRQDGHRPESGGRKRTAALGAAHPLRRGTGARTRSRALLCHLVEGRQAPVAHRRLGGQFLQRRLRRRKQGLCRRLRSDRRSVRRRILRTLSAEHRRHVAVRGRQRDASDALRPERRQTRDLPRRRRGGGRKHLRRRFRNAGKLRPKGRLLA